MTPLSDNYILKFTVELKVIITYIIYIKFYINQNDLIYY